jgi:hypothetical protein
MSVMILLSPATQLAAADEPWDGEAAAKGIFKLCGFGGRDFDVVAKAPGLRRELCRGSRRICFSLREGGSRHIGWPGPSWSPPARAAIPRDVRGKAREVLEVYSGNTRTRGSGPPRSF